MKIWPISNTTMKIWLISQGVNDGYGTYNAAVVAAETEDAARTTHPGSYDPDIYSGVVWVENLALVKVKLIGKAARGTKAGVICASYIAE